ncbi:MAG: hypothetical protein AAFN78_05500 [Pseudomonadota bacterium]
MFHRRTGFASLAALLAVMVLGACSGTADNRDLIVASGATYDDSAFTVNGDILVGENASVSGSKVQTVNGNIRVRGGATVRNVATTNGDIIVGEGAETGSIEAVNGAATCSDGARVDGDITLVNGSIVLATDSSVSGNVATVNGGISLTGAKVKGSVQNYHGDILLDRGAKVVGDIRVLGDDTPSDSMPARIVIGPDSTVTGELIFEHAVQLFVHDSASIGAVTGAEVVPFSGSMDSVVQGGGS